mgnify:CR=1 FL=1
MNNYLSKIALRAVPSEGSGRPAGRSLLPPGVQAPVLDTFRGKNVEQPAGQSENIHPDPVKREQIFPSAPDRPELSHREKYEEKPFSMNPPRYLNRQIERIQQVPVNTASKGSSPNDRNTDTNKETVSNKALPKTSPEQKSTRNDKNLSPDLRIKPADESKKTQSREAQTRMELPKNNTGPAARPVTEKYSSPEPVTVRPIQESTTGRRKAVSAPRLSIGRITVEVINPAPQTQTVQQIVRQTVAAPVPKSGSGGPDKLIFGFGQM